MTTYLIIHLILGFLGAIIVAKLELNQGQDYTLNDLVVPFVEESTAEDVWNNAIRRYGVRNAHIWFGIDNMSEVYITRDVLLERSGINLEEHEE